MKKILSFVFVLLFVCGSFAGCAAPAASEKISIVTTIFPEYDWVLQILGDRAADVDVHLLLDNGVDLHSFQPTAEDMIRISTCDLFIYVGGESDEWVEDALKEAVNPDMQVIDLLGVLGSAAKREEMVEGMEAEEEGEEDGDPEYDEHVWLSLRNAETFVAAIADAIAGLDAVNAEVYAANAAAYTQQLQALDSQFKETVSAASVRTLLFGDRFPFRYLTEDYGLSYYAAFSGCSAESEASFETVAFLANKIDELGLSVIWTLEGSNRKIAETVAAAAQKKDVRILSLDSMQSTTAKDLQNGETYLSVMEKNFSVLADALR